MSFFVFKVQQHVVGEHQGGNSFYYRDRSGQYTGVVPAFYVKVDDISTAVKGFLCLFDAGNRFESGVEKDVFPGTDTGIDATFVIADFIWRVVKLTAFEFAAFEAIAKFNTFNGIDAEDSLCQIGIEFIKYRFA